VINGKARSGYQIGAVATHSNHRNRGPARLLMKEVLGKLDAPDQPVILFANPSVLDFYPRFGFRRLAQDRFIARANLNPVGPPAPTLNITRPTDRAWLADHCGRAGFVGQGFAARLLPGFAISSDTSAANGLQAGVIWSGRDRPTGWRAPADRRPARDTALQFEGRLASWKSRPRRKARLH
jgi:Acetyltransferase (GNAT) domain